MTDLAAVADSHGDWMGVAVAELTGSRSQVCGQSTQHAQRLRRVTVVGVGVAAEHRKPSGR